jgi:hypothetical protein
MRAGVVGVVGVVGLALVGCEKDTRPPPFEPGLTVKLTRRKPEVHDRVLVVEETSLEAFGVMQGRNVPWKWHQHSERLIDVLSVDGFVVNAVHVTYTRAEESESVAGKDDGKHDTRGGKTYLVTRDGGQLMTTYEDGRVPPDDERDGVLYDNESVGIDDPTEAIVADKTWTSGKKVVFSDEELGRVNDRPVRAGGEKRTVRAMDMMLRTAKDGVATFEVGMVVERELHQNRQQVQVRGDMRVEIATGHWIESQATASMTGTYEGMSVNGSFKTKQSTRWTAAP